MNINQMMKQAQAMQKKMAEAQEKLAEIEVAGAAGGGMVNVTMTVAGKVTGIKIDPAVVDADDTEMLEDLLVAALNNARDQADARSQEEMGKLTGGLGLPPGIKMPF